MWCQLSIKNAIISFECLLHSTYQVYYGNYCYEIMSNLHYRIIFLMNNNFNEQFQDGMGMSWRVIVKKIIFSPLFFSSITGIKISSCYMLIIFESCNISHVMHPATNFLYCLLNECRQNSENCAHIQNLVHIERVYVMGEME